MICARDFPRGEVLVKVGEKEYGLYNAVRLFVCVCFSAAWAAPEEGEEGKGSSCPLCTSLAPSCSSPGKVLMAIKCPLVPIHMPKCDSLNVTFARQHIYLWFFGVSKYYKAVKFAATIACPKAKCFNFREGGLCPWPLNQGLCPWTSTFRPHTKNIAPLFPGLPLVAPPSFRFLAPPMALISLSICLSFSLHVGVFHRDSCR